MCPDEASMYSAPGILVALANFGETMRPVDHGYAIPCVPA